MTGSSGASGSTISQSEPDAVVVLALEKGLFIQAAQLRVAVHAEVGGDRLQVVDGDVVVDVDRVGTQQVGDERVFHPHDALLDVVEDVFDQVARADAIVSGIVVPVGTAPERGRQHGLARPGHAQERHRMVQGFEFIEADHGRE
jgi:methylmalonyl-CoA mutase cobalamin-binding subunit